MSILIEDDTVKLIEGKVYNSTDLSYLRVSIQLVKWVQGLRF